MKNDDGALSFGTSVDLRGLETGISQIEAKIATMEGKLGAKIDGIGKAVSRSGITAKSTLEDVTNAGNVLDGTLGMWRKPPQVSAWLLPLNLLSAKSSISEASFNSSKSHSRPCSEAKRKPFS